LDSDADTLTAAATAELIYPVTGKVVPAIPLVKRRVTAAMGLLPEGRALVRGGRTAHAITEVYLP
jgi:hypothetical protein